MRNLRKTDFFKGLLLALSFSIPLSLTAESSSVIDSSASSSSEAVKESEAASSSTASSPSSDGEGSESSVSIESEEDLDLPALKVEMTRETFALDPSLENRGALILAYEKLIAARCMPSLLTTLTYHPENLSDECAQAIGEVRKIDALNPVATCAEQGIDSLACRDTVKEQKVGLFGPAFDPNRFFAELEGLPQGTTPRLEDNVGKLLRELQQLAAIPLVTRTDFQRTRMQALYHRLMLLTCSVTRLALTPDLARKTPTPSSRNRPISENDSLEKFVEDFAKTAKPTPLAPLTDSPDPFEVTEGKDQKDKGSAKKEENIHFQRKRLISNTCWYFVQGALAFDSKFASAVCHRDGFQNPSCIDALRESRKRLALTPKPTRAPGSTPPGGPGFKTF